MSGQSARATVMIILSRPTIITREPLGIAIPSLPVAFQSSPSSATRPKPLASMSSLTRPILPMIASALLTRSPWRWMRLSSVGRRNARQSTEATAKTTICHRSGGPNRDVTSDTAAPIAKQRMKKSPDVNSSRRQMSDSSTQACQRCERMYSTIIQVSKSISANLVIIFMISKRKKRESLKTAEKSGRVEAKGARRV